VHRLVRISPFDSNARRHTSFSSVWVYPVVDDTIDIEIKESDCAHRHLPGVGRPAASTSTRPTRRCASPTFRPASWCLPAGAQPAQEPGKAWDMLRARLYEIELKKREEAANAIEAAKTDIGWGHQIRSYVLQPYQMVKDLRTGVETSNTVRRARRRARRFMEASLAQRSGYDCREVPKQAISERPQGYVIEGTGEVVTYQDARIHESPDGQYHWCSVAGADDSKTICLFVPAEVLLTILTAVLLTPACQQPLAMVRRRRKATQNDMRGRPGW
jgi:hypothetical protein